MASTGCSSMMKPFAPWDGFWETLVSIWTAWEVKAAFATVFMSFCAFLDIDERMVQFLCAAVIGDFIAGMAEAFKRKRFRCRAVLFGVQKVFWYSIYVCVVGLLNSALSRSMGMRIPLIDLFTTYLIASDCISIIGHLNGMGVPVPPLLISIARRVRVVSVRKTKKILREVNKNREDEN